MSLVVCGIYPSVNADYKAKAKQLNVSRTVVYDKLNRVEPTLSAALLRETAGDRNMCTQKFLFGVKRAAADFVIREHQTLPQQKVNELTYEGISTTGKLFEQTLSLSYDGESLLVRRVVLQLFKATRNGEKAISILTSLPSQVASAQKVAFLDRNRRRVENLFPIVTENYEGEIQIAYVMQDLAKQVDLSSFLKQPRGPKKKKEPPLCSSRHRHVSNARLLARAHQPP